MVLRFDEMDASQISFLKRLKYLFWWQTEEEMLAEPDRVLAKAMNEAVWRDWRVLEEVFPRNVLRAVLSGSRFGEFHKGMWNYWHMRLFPDMKFQDIPAMPRRFPDSPVEDGQEFWSRGRLGLARE